MLHQFRQRTHAQLMHYVSAINFHCALADAQLAGDLLVGTAVHHFRHDLVLAWRERMQQIVEFLVLPHRSPVFTVTFQRRFDAAQKILVAERLL